MYRREDVQMEYATIAGEKPVTVRCAVLESGYLSVASEAASFVHPTPAFSRLFLFRSGGGRVDIDGETCHLVSDRLYLLPTGHSFCVEYAGGSELLFFHLHIRDAQGLEITEHLRGLREMDEASAAHLVPQVLDGYLGEGWEAQLRWQSAVMQAILCLCHPLLPALAQQRQRASRYQGLLGDLQRQCTADLTVRCIAERLGVTAWALAKGFRRDVGTPLSTYMTQLIIQRACHLLLETDLQIQEIADSLGYGDPYYFDRVFKRQTGSSPRHYRQAVRQATFRT